MKHHVPFITIEEDDDLIVSFGLGPHAAQSLTLLRTPKFESMLPNDERGVTVSSGDPNAVDRELLISLAWGNQSVLIVSTQNEYELDIGSVSPDEVMEAKSVIRKMNFDRRFKVQGA